MVDQSLHQSPYRIRVWINNDRIVLVVLIKVMVFILSYQFFQHRQVIYFCEHQKSRRISNISSTNLPNSNSRISSNTHVQNRIQNGSINTAQSPFKSMRGQPVENPATNWRPPSLIQLINKIHVLVKPTHCVRLFLFRFKISRDLFLTANGWIARPAKANRTRQSLCSGFFSLHSPPGFCMDLVSS